MKQSDILRRRVSLQTAPTLPLAADQMRQVAPVSDVAQWLAAIQGPLLPDKVVALSLDMGKPGMYIDIGVVNVKDDTVNTPIVRVIGPRRVDLAID